MRIYRIPRRDNLLVGGSCVAADRPCSGYATCENDRKKCRSYNWYQIIRTILNSTVTEIDKFGTTAIEAILEIIINNL